MSQPTTDEKIRFRGVCLNGPLKGKEIEGKLNIEFNIESIKPGKKTSDSSGWSSVVIVILLLLGLNSMVFRGTEGSKNRAIEAHFLEPSPQAVDNFHPEDSD